MKVTSIILAGGKNRRLGRNKALEAIQGRSVLEHVMEQIRPIASQILIVTSEKQSALLAGFPAETLVDIYPDRGPLGGIYTGLLASQYSHSIVVACDMPFLNTELLHFMTELSPGFEATVPRIWGETAEPLHAVYSKSCLGKMKERLELNQLGMHSFLKTVRVRYVDRTECQRSDPRLLSFFNINYQSDLEQAIALSTALLQLQH